MDKLLSKAKWVCAPESFASPVISRTFTVSGAKKATIAISALGFFILYVNGKRVGNEFFLPSPSIFRERDTKSFLYPIYDKFTYRCYYSVYDISEYLIDGQNKIEIELGDGRYRQTERTNEGNVSYGNQLGTIYAIKTTSANGDSIIVSDGSEDCRSSQITFCNLFYGEKYDARIKEFETAKPQILSLPQTILSPEIAPPDRIIRTIKPTLVLEGEESTIYDVGENISGFVSLKITAKENECVRIRFAENITDNALDFRSTGAVHSHNPLGEPQIMEDVFFSDGTVQIYEPRFVWHAFRYFEIIGSAEPVLAHVIHSDVKKTGDFKSSSEVLNTFFDVFLRTQTNNMHGGVPLDCPHRERLGYTGDGQVCAPATMFTLDSKNFYKKWICDIFDSQDKITGHVNHTAPFDGGGGGPGGWGMAAITVPYNYYKIYGDITPAKENYENIKKWISYLEDHSENGLIVREEDGGWCLGDWCTLDKTVIDEAYANTCLFIRALDFVIEIAQALGFDDDIEIFKKVKSVASNGIIDKYYDADTGSFLDGIQGADAFAIAAGLGDERTLRNLKNKYKALGHFDTGFLCTDLLCEVLVNNGEEDALFDLITSQEPGGFGYMFLNGATTLWETWHGIGSHDHPMFGGCARTLIEGFLGITQSKTSYGFENIIIAPKTPRKLDYAKGYTTTPHGVISSDWERRGNDIVFEITLPDDTTAEFIYNGETHNLHSGKNTLIINEKAQSN